MAPKRTETNTTDRNADELELRELAAALRRAWDESWGMAPGSGAGGGGLDDRWLRVAETARTFAKVRP